MNSTKWATLAEFVAHLGKTGQVEVEETPKGYFIKYIDRDPAAIARQEAIKKKEKMDMDDEARAQRRIDAQMAALREYTAANGEPEDPLIHNNDNNNTQEVSATETPQAEAERKPEDKIAFSLQLKKAPLDITKKEEVKPDGEAENEKKRKRAEDDSPAPMSIPTPTAPSVPKKAKLSALDEIKLQQEAKKEKEGRKDYWLHTGIIVKILNKTLKGGALYKQKAIVSSVEERYIAVLRTIDGGLKLKMDQQELETVLPARGGKVLIVNGAYRFVRYLSVLRLDTRLIYTSCSGDEAVLVDIDTKEFKASVKIDSGLNKGERIMKNYEDVCKLASPEEMK
jgi:DNA/RNA-binding protein KIN17